MADIFISYAREDRSRAELVANALSAAGIETFWDTDIPPGKTWADYIEGKLSAAKALIVLWSEHSTKSQWVREEARIARDRHKLIPAMLDATPAPFGFGEVQAANLAHWTGDANDAEWKRVEAAVRAAIASASAGEGAPPPPVAPPPPGAPPPPPQPQPMPQLATMLAPGAEAHSPIEYIKKCLRHYVDGKGRARRSEFWWFALFYFVLMFIAAVIDSGSGFNYYTSMPNSMALMGLVFLALVCPLVSVAARRFHDVGMNGWLVALGFIPWLGAIFIMVIGFIPGTPGVNKYGPNPKGA